MKLAIRVTPNFAKDVKKLAKRYKFLAKDLTSLKNELIKNPKSGANLGKNCFKIRVANSSTRSGKSGGFRVIYYFIDESGFICLLAIYSKSDMESISDEKISQILKDNELD